MQGSSTGDNKLMVKYIWETDEEGWVLASKGGGYSKWGGLNFYKVKWGKRGELLKGNKGSALRNSSEIDNTAIVYSDTGTLGLSTRERLDGQVFIASGPGIKVLKGDPLCHLACRSLLFDRPCDRIGIYSTHAGKVFDLSPPPLSLPSHLVDTV